MTRTAGIRSLAGLIRAGRFEEASQALASPIRAPPSSPRDAVAEARIALMSNELGKAEALLQASLAKQSRPKVAGLLAEVYYRRDEFGPAAAWFRRAGREVLSRKLVSFDGSRPNEVRGPPQTSLDLVQTNPLPLVRLTVNDCAEGYFLVDTGGSELLLDSEFARRVGAIKFGRERGTYAGGRHAAYEHGAVETVSMGSFQVRHMPVHAMPLDRLRGIAGGRRVAGIVGTVPLYHFRFTLDYPAGRLILRRRTGAGERLPSKPSLRSSEVPIWMDGDHFLLARGRVNQSDQLLFIDSGLAGGGFACPESTLRAAGIALPEGKTLKGEGAGGSVDVRLFRVARLEVGRAVQTGVVGVQGVFPPFLERHFGYRIGGLLSHGFLRHYRVTFDFERMHMALESDVE